MLRLVPAILALLLLCHCAAPSGADRSAAAKSQPLDAFIQDRPDAAALLRRHRALERWLRAELQKPIGAYQLAWDNAAPPSGASGEHRKYPEHRSLVIRISDRLAPADQLAGLVYEVINSRGRERFQELENQARQGAITRDAFIDGLLAVEHEALVRTKALLPRLLPLSGAEQASLRLYPAFLDAPASYSDFEKWRGRHTRDFDVRAAYGEQYDRIAAR